MLSEDLPTFPVGPELGFLGK